MPHILANPDSHIGKSYKNAAGETHCVEFLRQALALPNTATWYEGNKVIKGGNIDRGTAIATFDSPKK